MNNKPVLVDSNIIIYAINRSSPKHKAAQTFLQTHAGQLVLAHQNIFESLRVLTHKKYPNPMEITDATKAVSNIAEFCRVMPPDYKAHHLALAMIQKYKLTGDKIFDAYLAATAISAGIKRIATDNIKDFSKFDEITSTNPFETAKEQN